MNASTIFRAYDKCWAEYTQASGFLINFELKDNTENWKPTRKLLNRRMRQSVKFRRGLLLKLKALEATAAGADSLQTLIDLCKQHLFDTCTCREDWTSRRMIDPECLYHDGHNEIFEAIRAIEATTAGEET